MPIYNAGLAYNSTTIYDGSATGYPRTYITHRTVEIEVPISLNTSIESPSIITNCSDERQNEDS